MLLETINSKRNESSSFAKLVIIGSIKKYYSLHKKKKKKHGKNLGSSRNKQRHHTLTIVMFVGKLIKKNSINNLEKIDCIYNALSHLKISSVEKVCSLVGNDNLHLKHI
jgi:hypothetical protein